MAVNVQINLPVLKVFEYGSVLRDDSELPLRHLVELEYSIEKWIFLHFGVSTELSVKRRASFERGAQRSEGLLPPLKISRKKGRQCESAHFTVGPALLEARRAFFLRVF